MFYAFNSKEFGDKLKEVRLSMNLSQPDVSKRIGISIDGLRKIEKGFVTPRFETLVKLSSLYKINLVNLMSIYSKVTTLEDYYDKAQAFIDNADIKGLEKLKGQLSLMVDSSIKSGLILIEEQEQFSIFCDASILFLQNNEESLKNASTQIITALQLTIHRFYVERLDKFIYNQFEIRFLHLLALTERRLLNYDKAINLLTHILSVTKHNKNDLDSIKNLNLLYFSLSYTYFEIKDYENSLKYADIGIDFSIENRRMNELHFLYYRKGMAEYFLNSDSYKSSLNTSVTILEAVRSPLAKVYRDVTKEKYNIEI